MPNVIMVHGWMSTPNHHWFPWLRKNLRVFGFRVYAPRMPEPIRPDKKRWLARLEAVLKGKDPRDTILIGHSLGVPTILYALQEHRGPKYAHVILVGGFARKIPRLDEVTDGYDMKLDLDRIRSKARYWTVIHGDYDPLVPFKEGKWLAKRLGAVFIIEKNRGHLSQYEGVLKLESALQVMIRGAMLKKGHATDCV